MTTPVTKKFNPAGPLGLGLLAALLALAFSCKKDKAEPAEECGLWEYEGEYGPDHWGNLAPVCQEYAFCGGSAQSPVDITGAAPDASLEALATNYAASSTHIIHNGHTLEFEVEEGSSALELNGEEYELLQFHFHAQSEHTIGGAAHHMEAHFVHANAATGDRAVIGVMFKDGAENAFLKPFMNQPPAALRRPPVHLAGQLRPRRGLSRRPRLFHLSGFADHPQLRRKRHLVRARTPRGSLHRTNPALPRPHAQELPAPGGHRGEADTALPGLNRSRGKTARRQ